MIDLRPHEDPSDPVERCHGRCGDAYHARCFDAQGGWCPNPRCDMAAPGEVGATPPSERLGGGPARRPRGEPGDRRPRAGDGRLLRFARWAAFLVGIAGLAIGLATLGPVRTALRGYPILYGVIAVGIVATARCIAMREARSWRGFVMLAAPGALPWLAAEVCRLPVHPAFVLVPAVASAGLFVAWSADPERRGSSPG